MALAFLYVVLGFVILVFGADVLVRAASKLAVLFQLTPAVIGLTIVAFGTSAPELAVSLAGVLSGSNGIAVGNVVGSNVLNLGLVLGLTAMVAPMAIRSQAIKIEWPVMFIASCLALLFMRDGEIDRLEGLLFLGSFFTFTVFMIFLARKEIIGVDIETELTVSEEAEPHVKRVPPVPFYLLGIALGVGMLTGGSSLLVEGASTIARELGWSEVLIGLTIVAFGTSLPELATSVVAAFKGAKDLAIGNLIGSNIANLLLILGVTATIRPIAIPAETIEFDNYWMVGIAFLLFPLMATGKNVNRFEGLLLFASFIAYYAVRFVVITP